jgi:hypothetical protein
LKHFRLFTVVFNSIINLEIQITLLSFLQLEMSASAENEPEQLLLTPAKRCPPETADRQKTSTEKFNDKESSSKITTRAKERQQIKREKN